MAPRGLDDNPVVTAAKVRCLVLAIKGGMDVQVAAGSTRSAARRAACDNPEIAPVFRPPHARNLRLPEESTHAGRRGACCDHAVDPALHR
jgi:hypothetical protein